MTSELKTILSGLTPLEFRELELQIQTARYVKDLIENHKLTPKEFCREMGITMKKYHLYFSGAQSYTIKDWAKLDTLRFKLERIQASRNEKPSFAVAERNTSSNPEEA